MSDKLRLVVLGMMGRCPFSGKTWLNLNWLRGFTSWANEVWYVEDDLVWPYDPRQNVITYDCSYAIRHIAGCMERIGLPDQWVFRLPDPRLGDRTNACWGMSVQELGKLYRSCDAVLT